MRNHIQCNKNIAELFCLRNHVNFIKKSYLSDLVRVEKVFVAEAREGDAAARLLLVQSVEIVQKIFKSHSLKRLTLHKLLIREGSCFHSKFRRFFSRIPLRNRSSYIIVFYKLLIKEGSGFHSKVKNFFLSYSLKRLDLYKLLQVIREGEMFHSIVQKVFSRTP